MQYHHGSITANSDGSDQGSQFTLRFPLPNTDTFCSKLTDEPEEIVVSQKPILIAEDNEDFSYLLQHKLKKAGHDVIMALTSGREVISNIYITRADVVMLDMGLPEKDGYQIVEELTRYAYREKIIFIRLSGYNPDVGKIRNLFDFYLVKPLPMKELLAPIR